MAMILLLLCAATVSAGIGGGRAKNRQHPHSSTTSLGDLLEGNDDPTELNITQAEPTRNLEGQHDILTYGANYGRSIMEAVVVGRPHVDFGSIVEQGDVAEIFLVLCHPSRLIRSLVLSWVATEVWRQSGLFQKRRRPKKLREGKRYRRFTSTRKTYKKQIKGVIEEPLDEELFQQEYASSRREQRARTSSDTFSNIVPESQEKGNALTKTQKERLLKEYEVSRPKSRLKSKNVLKSKTGKKIFKLGFPRLTRKKKFRLAWSLGHMLSPCLMAPMGAAIAGWMGVLCAGAELIPWVDKKCKLDVLEDNELLEWMLEPFRDNDILKALLFGSMVGACYSNI